MQDNRSGRRIAAGLLISVLAAAPMPALGLSGPGMPAMTAAGAERDGCPAGGAAAPVPGSQRLASPPARFVHGLVADRAGRPIGHARVLLRPAAGTLTVAADPASARRSEAVTDAAGRFEIHGLDSDTLDVKVTAGGYSPAVVRGLRVPARALAADLGTIVLQPGERLDGTVVNAQGRPVAGARVQGLAFEVAWGADREEPWRASTGRDGRFALSGLGRGVLSSLRVEKAGYTPVTLAGLEIPPAEPLRIVLDATATVRGRILDQAGAPVAQAAVALVHGARTAEGLRGAAQTTTSDSRGRYEIAGAGLGPLTIQVSLAGALTSERGGFEVRAGEVLEIPDLVLRGGAVVAGRVATAAGEPAAGSRVRWTGCGSDYLPCREALAGADGTYRLEGLPTGHRSIVAEHPDHPRASAGIDVEPGINHLDLQLGNGYPVTGTVTDAGGRPVEGALVLLFAGEAEHQAQTAADGSFRWAGIPSGGYELVASKPGYASARAGRLVVDDAPLAGVEVRLESGRAVSGQVLGLGFEELARVTVVASGGGGTPPVVGALGYDGTYTVGDLGLGVWSVAATVAGTGRTVEESVTLSAGGGDVRVDLDFARGFSLAGQVLVGGTAAITGEIQIQSQGPRRFLGSSPVDADGRFRLGGVPPGPYLLEVVAPGAEPLRQSVELEADAEMSFDLRPAAPSGPRSSRP
jgi:hypothetical protein